MKSTTTLNDINWDSWRAKDIATLAFVIVGEQMLLIRKKRGLGAGKINGPGGRLEADESVEKCAIRETREELGVTPLDIKKGGELQFQFIDGYSIHVHVFRAEGLEGTPVETEEAIPLWASLAAIPYDEMWEDDKIWLPHLIAGNPFHGRFLFDNDKLIDHELQVFYENEAIQ